MGKYIPALIYVPNSGQVTKPMLLKQGGESFAMRAGRVAAHAISLRTAHYAIRFGRQWSIHHVSGPPSQPLKEGLTYDAAFMWLMHKGKRDG